MEKVCNSGVHCGTCRQEQKGARFRAALAAVGVAECPKGLPMGWEPPSRGLGDTVAKVLKRVGIKPCGGCKKRQAALNQLVPYSQPEPHPREATARTPADCPPSASSK